MPIPPLDNRGLLPGGCHIGTYGEIEQIFTYSKYRLDLYRQVRSFLDGELKSAALGLRLILGGSFFSDKQNPADIEATVYLPFVEVSKRNTLVALANQQAHDRIKMSYRADFYVSLVAPGYNDFGAFFQYVGPKTAQAKGLHEKDARGVIEVTPW